MEGFDNDKYERAKKRMEEIKGFYTHLVVYLIINTLLILAQMGVFTNWGNVGMPTWAYFTTPFFWGIGLAAHGLYVFQHKFRSFKNWEERKIKEYMEREEREFNNNQRWD